MKLVPENFKLIPATYNGNDFMKIQYEDKDLVMKLKGEFHIIDVKNYGLRLIFTPDDYSIIDKIHELGGYKNESKYNYISLSMNKTTPFFNRKNILMDQNKCRTKPNALKKNQDAWMRRCLFFIIFTLSGQTQRSAEQVKVNEFLEEEIKSMFDEED